MTVYFCSQARLAASRASPLVMYRRVRQEYYAFSFPTYIHAFTRTRSRFGFRLRSSLVSTACRSRLPSNNKRVWNASFDTSTRYIYLASGLYCIMYVSISFSFTSMLQSCISLKILMSVLVGMIHAISMPHVSTLLVAMTVNVCHVSWEVDSIVQVSACLVLHAYIISILFLLSEMAVMLFHMKS